MTRAQRTEVLKYLVACIGIAVGLGVMLIVFWDNEVVFGPLLAGLVASVVCSFLGMGVIRYQHKITPRSFVEKAIEGTGFEDIDSRQQDEAWSVGLDCTYGRRRVLLAFTPPPLKGMPKGNWLGISSPIVFHSDGLSMESMCHVASLSMQFGYGTFSSILVVSDPSGGSSILVAISWCEVDGITSNEIRHRVIATAHLADMAISVFAGKVKEGEACA